MPHISILIIHYIIHYDDFLRKRFPIAVRLFTFNLSFCILYITEGG